MSGPSVKGMEKVAQLAKQLEEFKWFDITVVSCIIIAAISSGVQTYESFALKHESFFEFMGLGILVIFTIESIVKITAQYPRPVVYFHDSWNVFDFVIVLMGWIFNPIVGFLDFPQAALLRIIRLLRVLKLVKAFPELQMLVSALLRSVPSMFYVLCLLMLLFYLFSVTAVVIFGENDPIHFGTLEIALLSMWRITTFEDWTDIMYINMYGCNVYGYEPPVRNATYDPQNPIHRASAADFVIQKSSTDLIGECTNSSAYGAWAAIYFVFFTIFSTMIVVNLFVGVILNGVDEAQQEQDADFAKEAKEKAIVWAREQASAIAEGRPLVTPVVGTGGDYEVEGKTDVKQFATQDEVDVALSVLDKLRADPSGNFDIMEAMETEEILESVPPFPENFSHESITKINDKVGPLNEKLDELNVRLLKHYKRVYAKVLEVETRLEKTERIALIIAENKFFDSSIVCCIFIAAINSGLQTYPALAEEHEDTLNLIDNVILHIFAMEMVIKIVAAVVDAEAVHNNCGWYSLYKFLAYLKDPWNKFDCVIVLIGYLFTYVVTFPMISIIRIIRLLRVLKLVKAFPELRVLVGAVLTSIPSMCYVMCLLFLLFYLFAVTAVTMLGDNDPIHFGNLMVALLSLYRISTFEDWTDIMYINMYGCNNYGYDSVDPQNSHRCDVTKSFDGKFGALAALFFVFFTFMATLIILNLFVGVILGGVEKAQNEEAEKSLEEQLILIKKKNGELSEAIQGLDFNMFKSDGGEGGNMGDVLL